MTAPYFVTIRFVSLQIDPMAPYLSFPIRNATMRHRRINDNATQGDLTFIRDNVYMYVPAGIRPVERVTQH